ncbi:MAG: DUF262 domain-containing protein [Chlorobiaceae bacterium]
MQANPVRICEYLNGEKQNLIPVFQRPYSWKQDKWETLWQDIIQVYDDLDRPKPKHFMGAIVSMPQSSVPVGVNKHLIIDGQQRLSTMCLLLCAIRDFERTSEKTKNRILGYLTNQHFENSPDYLKFVPTNLDRDVYKAIVTNPASTHDMQHTMINAYQEFLAKLQNYSGEELLDIDELFDVIVQNLQVVMISLDDVQDDPYLIFESLNNKGEPLVEADLVRNYIMMRFQHSDSQNGEQQHVYDEYWKPIEVAIKDKMTQFLRHYIHKNGISVKRNCVYASIKNALSNIQQKDDLLAEIKNINVHSKSYEYFIYSDRHQNPVISSYLKMFDDLGMTTCYPLLLRLFQSFNEGVASIGELKNSLRLIEAFSIRRQICGVPSNSLDQIFVSWCKNYELPIDSSLWNFMREGTGNKRWPSDEEFSNNIRTRTVYGQKVTLQFLRRIEASFGHKEVASLEKATIEHIMPQTLSTEWREYLGTNCHIIYDRYCNTLGNLTLSAYNTELSNDVFSIKRQRYEESNIEMNKRIARNLDWRESEISNRASDIAVIACQTWKGLE